MLCLLRCFRPIVAILLLVSSFPVRADRVDDYVRQQMEQRHIPGLSLAVVRDGKIVKAKGYGFANLEWKTPVTPETLFQSGSVGKQFTATAVMMLVEEGKIGLEDSICKYLTDAPPAWKSITIRHLLTHTSGIGNIYGVLNMRQDYTEDELVKKAASVPVEFAPGEKWVYSNTGYQMLGVLIHKVTGKFYGDFLKERVFTPLGMTTARVINEEDIIPNRAAGYQLKGTELKNQEWVAPSLNTTADGSLYVTALDMAKWDAALYTEKLLKKSSFDLMWTPVKLNSGATHAYGFGWAVNTANGHRLIEHNGAWQGFLSAIARYVDDRLTVIVLVNTDSASPPLIAHRVAGFYLPAVAPPTYKPIPDKEPQITALVKMLYDKRATGDWDEPLFTPAFWTTLKPSLKDETALAYFKGLGPVQSVTLVERKAEGDNRLYRYRVAYRDMTRLALLTLDRAGKISNIETTEE